MKMRIPDISDKLVRIVGFLIRNFRPENVDQLVNSS